jgi:hypothetical protein
MQNFRQKILDLNLGFFNLKQSNVQEWPSNFISNHDFSNQFIKVSLPKWFHNVGVGPRNEILIPLHCIKQGSNSWRDVDWWRAAYEMLTMRFEYHHEKANGSIHSYSYKLPHIPSEVYDKAWVNRIFLFLRKWVACSLNKIEDDIFLPIPKPLVYLTHDVDYIKKTFVLKLKYTAFELYKILKKQQYKNIFDLKSTLKHLFEFNFSSDYYLNYKEIFLLESKINARSYWNFYSRRNKFKSSFLEWLIDPSYYLNTKQLKTYLDFLNEKGLEVGLHQGFHSWNKKINMLEEKNKFESVLNKEIVSCRQHWLRFSLEDTWSIQESLGFQLDMTLGFNDRIGFRNCSALKTPAWLSNKQVWSKTLKTVPMILMDSHLFDYGQHEIAQRRKKIDDLLDEISMVGGCASIIWHTHGFSKEYDWKEDYIYLLDAINKRGILTND